jgi:hypothetical protein
MAGFVLKNKNEPMPTHSGDKLVSSEACSTRFLNGTFQTATSEANKKSRKL